MCKYCEDKTTTLIESEKIGNPLRRPNDTLTVKEMYDLADDFSLVMEIRNNKGYLRLGDREEMGCLDHNENVEINYCPFCGKKIEEVE